ncbi:MAG TPA: hypothetical protein VLE71_05170 [Actinomycetota bacterium]|nr:hypothetical protein [Actinomycetota bacterium]
MNARVRLVGAVLLASLATACAGEASSHDEASPQAQPCEAGFTTPEGFRQTERFHDPYPDHVGIRLGFMSDDGGRELHYFAGIPGEFGEGLPLAGTIVVAQGLEGPLQGSKGTWVLSWQAPGPCGVRAVLGTGFTRSSFLHTLERAAIVQTQ